MLTNIKSKYLALVAVVVGTVVGLAGPSHAQTATDTYDAVSSGLEEGFTQWVVAAGVVIVFAIGLGFAVWGVPQLIAYGKKVYRASKAG